MKTAIRISCVLFFLLLLGGCATSITSEVTRYHKDVLPSGETIAIVPLNDAKKGSLEFAAHAQLVAKKLTEIGYKVVNADANPQLLAKMDYTVGPGETKIQTWPRNFVHYHFYYGHAYPYFYGTYWDEPDIYSYTVYMRTLILNIVKTDGESIFEGHVDSVGQEHSLNKVMPYLVDAMFNNYPGESGVTKVVTIQQDSTNHPY